MAIAYDPRKGELRLETSRLGADGKRPELWVIPEGGAPRSLGMIRDDGGSLAIDPAVRPLLRGGATLAITLEDAATGPHAAPTSAPILIGKITII